MMAQTISTRSMLRLSSLAITIQSFKLKLLIACFLDNEAEHNLQALWSYIIWTVANANEGVPKPDLIS